MPKTGVILALMDFETSVKLALRALNRDSPKKSDTDEQQIQKMRSLDAESEHMLGVLKKKISKFNKAVKSFSDAQG